MAQVKAGKVNSHNEWGKLKEVIVGTADGTIATLAWKRAVQCIASPRFLFRDNP
jgi:hypothetical protein